MRGHRASRSVANLSPGPLVLGTMARRSADPEQRLALFRHAVERGVRCFDTAPLYDFGATESLLGRLRRDFPGDELQIYTKVGLSWSSDARGPVHFETVDDAGTPRVVRRDSSPQAIRESVEQSLGRLGVESLDLAQVHFRDTDTPVAETMGALAALRAAGKIRAIGVSNFTLAEVGAAQQALGDVTLDAVQLRLNLLQRQPLSDLVPWCLDQGIRVLAYSPLAEGRLATDPELRADSGSDAKLTDALRQFGQIARDLGVDRSVLALGWLLRQPGVNAVVAGASSSEQLDQQLAVLERPLDAETVSMISGVFAGLRLRESWEVPLWRRVYRKLLFFINKRHD